MRYIGIDPGLEGAVALIGDGLVVVENVPVINVGGRKKTRREIDPVGCLFLLRELIAMGHEHVAAIESVHSMPEQGVASSFTFGKGFGIWIGLITSLGIPFDLVTPQRWKKVMMDGMGKDKGASVYRARQLFPLADLSLKKHHGRADALLIAEWRRRQG